MADALVVAEALIVAPEADDLVLAAGDEVLALGGDREGVDLALLAAVEHADRLGVERGPVRDLFVRARRQELALLGVVDDRLLEVRLFHGVHAGE